MFEVGEKVVVVAPSRTRVVGVVRARVWHHKHGRDDIYLTIHGRPHRSRYAENEIRHAGKDALLLELGQLMSSFSEASYNAGWIGDTEWFVPALLARRQHGSRRSLPPEKRRAASQNTAPPPS